MDYTNLKKEIEKLKGKGFETGSIGKSVLGREIFFVRVGDKKNNIIVQGSIHAREHITCDLIIEQIKSLYDERLYSCGIVFLPMTNPDGVEIVYHGVRSIFDKKIKEKVAKELEKVDKEKFKANVNLVDLNVNFDAKWGQGVSNVFYPHFENYVGESVCSEPETKALSNFTKEISAIGTISYHAKGEEIYYRFGKNQNLTRDFLIAKKISDLTGYDIKSTVGSVGGYKDFCIEKLKIPALTIEVGSDRLTHPISKIHLPKIFKENENVPLTFLREVLKS